MEIKAIETEYKGYKFRSRTEARLVVKGALSARFEYSDRIL